MLWEWDRQFLGFWKLCLEEWVKETPQLVAVAGGGSVGDESKTVIDRNPL